MSKPKPDLRVHLRSTTSAHACMPICRSPRKGLRFSADPDDVTCKGCRNSTAWQGAKMLKTREGR